MNNNGGTFDCNSESIPFRISRGCNLVCCSVSNINLIRHDNSMTNSYECPMMQQRYYVQMIPIMVSDTYPVDGKAKLYSLNLVE